VDLVDEQHVTRLQVGQQGGEIAGARDDRARGGAETDTELARHDLRQRGLAETGRPVQQHVIERLVATLRRQHEDAQVLARLLLADEIIERDRAQTDLA